ncbi:hypothetical protein FBUS_10236 [Fasciolopsis buskii]|uniref:Uncharacterized protein n=1 Tax=Fasciolopsis buskii TaxID=27845 RepID=A0A8E0VDZ3_9TREM|nr:hypothetical protein FBUS_10236 [Fasciolopsis buski]
MSAIQNIHRTSAPSFYKSKARYFPGQIGKPNPIQPNLAFQSSILEDCHKENRPSASVGFIALDSDSVKHRVPSHGRRASDKSSLPKKLSDPGRRDSRRMDWITHSNPFGGTKHTSIALKRYETPVGGKSVLFYLIAFAINCTCIP